MFTHVDFFHSVLKVSQVMVVMLCTYVLMSCVKRYEMNSKGKFELMQFRGDNMCKRVLKRWVK